jgi:hypothetical protein
VAADVAAGDLRPGAEAAGPATFSPLAGNSGAARNLPRKGGEHMTKEMIDTALGADALEAIEEKATAEPDPHLVSASGYSFRHTRDLSRIHWLKSGSVWTPNTVMLGKVLQALHEKGYSTSLTRHRDGRNTVNFR